MSNSLSGPSNVADDGSAVISRRIDEATANQFAEAIQNYIIAMDVFKVGMTTVDQIRPVLADLIQSLNNVLSLPADFEGRAKVREWLTKLDSMGAVDKLSAEDKGQLEFDLETNCTAFRGWLEGPR